MSILLFALSLVPAAVFGLQNENSTSSSTDITRYVIFFVCLAVVVLLVLLVFLCTAFCCRCCCFKKYDDYFNKRKEARDKAQEQAELEESYLLDPSCVVDIGKKIDKVRRNIDILFSLIKNEFIHVDKAYPMFAHIMAKCYFVLSPTSTVNVLLYITF